MPLRTPQTASVSEASTAAISAATRKLDDENLTVSELREVVLTMIARKEQIECMAQALRVALGEETARSSGLGDQVRLLEKELANVRHSYENRIQTIENENKLLKDQLKKYVSAVQLMRPYVAGGDVTVQAQQVAPMPAANPNLQRDYSYEAEQYEKKLIQVILNLFYKLRTS